MGRDTSDSSRPRDPLLTRAPASVDHDPERIYLDHSQRLRGLAAAVTFDRAAAEEITHDAFAGLSARSHEVSDPVAYLQRSVINLAISHVRRRVRARNIPRRRIEHPSIPEVDQVWDALADALAAVRAERAIGLELARAVLVEHGIQPFTQPPTAE